MSTRCAACRPVGAALGAVLLAAWVGTAEPAHGQASLIADLSSHVIAISSSFTGTEVLVFGATDGKGDVVVVIRGPEQPVVVRRKRQVAGVWVNRKAATFNRVPGYYALAASRSLAELGADELLAYHQIGIENLRFDPAGELAAEDVEAFHDALVHIKQSQNLYVSKVEPVIFIGEQLFRTTVRFPANVPTGTYTAEVFQFRDGAVVSAQTTPLTVTKTGVEAEIFDFAHEQAPAYGLLAVLLAVVAGWLGNITFRKA
ncbi:MAG: TIGR02186 family protein [Alphaproteobacteria bacterium]